MLQVCFDWVGSGEGGATQGVYILADLTHQESGFKTTRNHCFLGILKKVIHVNRLPGQKVNPAAIVVVKVLNWRKY